MCVPGAGCPEVTEAPKLPQSWAGQRRGSLTHAGVGSVIAVLQVLRVPGVRVVVWLQLHLDLVTRARPACGWEGTVAAAPWRGPPHRSPNTQHHTSYEARKSLPPPRQFIGEPGQGPAPDGCWRRAQPGPGDGDAGSQLAPVPSRPGSWKLWEPTVPHQPLPHLGTDSEQLTWDVGNVPRRRLRHRLAARLLLPLRLQEHPRLHVAQTCRGIDAGQIL